MSAIHGETCRIDRFVSRSLDLKRVCYAIEPAKREEDASESRMHAIIREEPRRMKCFCMDGGVAMAVY